MPDRQRPQAQVPQPNVRRARSLLHDGGELERVAGDVAEGRLPEGGGRPGQKLVDEAARRRVRRREASSVTVVTNDPTHVVRLDAVLRAPEEDTLRRPMPEAPAPSADQTLRRPYPEAPMRVTAAPAPSGRRFFDAATAISRPPTPAAVPVPPRQLVVAGETVIKAAPRPSVVEPETVIKAAPRPLQIEPETVIKAAPRPSRIEAETVIKAAPRPSHTAAETGILAAARRTPTATVAAPRHTPPVVSAAAAPPQPPAAARTQPPAAAQPQPQARATAAPESLPASPEAAEAAPEPPPAVPAVEVRRRGKSLPVPPRDLTPAPMAPAEGSQVRRLFRKVVTAVTGGLAKPKPAADATAEPVAAKPKARGKAKADAAKADATPEGALTPEAWSRLRALPLLDGIRDEDLRAAATAGEVRLITSGRDDLLDAEAAALLVVDGQVALAELPANKLAAEKTAQSAVNTADKKAVKKEAKRRTEQGPLIRLATRNLAFFESGDLVHLKPGARPADAARAFALYAVTPVTAVAIAGPRVEAWQRAYPSFADRVRRAEAAAATRIQAACGTDGARAEVADFFIRHGLSVALVLRVREIDKCIECGACEAACEERYGAARLSLRGRILGGLDFVDACHTCFDQRCIDPCNFDAIKFDVDKREVVIIEGACTGCTLCATACPYNAIEMHDLDEKPLLRFRLEKQGDLAFGDGAGAIATDWGEIPRRKAKLKRMASKCDHCINFADQACISACPTGALFDADPGDVFHARPQALVAAAKAGFDHTALVDTRHLDPRPFVDGLERGEARRIDRARAVRPRIVTTWMWVVGLGSWLLCLAEILLRKYAPSWSVDFLLQTRVDGLDPEMALGRVDFRPGCDLAVRLGTVGSLILLGGLVYPARRRVPFMRGVGSQRAWFEMHVLTGVVGPLFVLLHTAAKLDNWVSLAFWSMVIAVVSGLAGRYLFTQLPEWASAASLEAADVERRLDALRAQHSGITAMDNWLSSYKERLAAASARSPFHALGFLLVDDLRRIALRRDLAGRIAGLDRKTRHEAVRAALELGRHERRRVLYPRIELLFRRWKLVHVPFAVALTVVGGLHIVLSLLA